MRRFLMIGILFNLLILRSVAYSMPSDSTKAWLTKLQSSEPDTNKIKLLLKLGHNILYKPNLSKKQLDSTFRFFDQSLNLAEKLDLPRWKNEAALSLVQYLLDKRDTVAALSKFNGIADGFRRSGDFKNEIEAWIRMARMLESENGSNSASMAYLIRAIKLSEDDHYTLGAANAVKGMGLLYYHKNNLKLAIPKFLEAIALYKACGEVYERYHYQALLADYYWDTGNIQQSLFYSIEAYNTSQLTHDLDVRFAGDQALGRRYFYLANYGLAVEYLEHALNLAKALKNVSIYHLELYNLVYSRVQLKQTKGLLAFINEAEKEMPAADENDKVNLEAALGMAYDTEGDFTDAEANFQKMYSSFEKLNKKNGNNAPANFFLRSYNRMLGNFYIRHKKYEQARPFFDKIIRLPMDILSPWTLSEAHLGLFKVDSAAGNYVAAIKHFERNRQLHDSIFNIQATAKVSELNIKYETSQRLKDIKLLKSERDAQEADKQKVKLQRDITLAGIAIVILIAGLIFKNNRSKQRSNRQLQDQQIEINSQNIALQQLLAEKEAFLTEKDDMLLEKEELLAEKDWLIKEVHHRVKNNLQIVMSLLRTQSTYIKNEAAIKAISEGLYRVKAIALLHQKLYNDSNVTAINMQAYVFDLVDYLSDGFNTDKRAIQFKKSVEELNIDLVQAVPVGLILNEAITNAIKYAFDDEGGLISISLSLTGNNIVLLEIKDNGMGFKSDLALKEHQTFGMNMMRGLSRQLKGTFNTKNEAGITVAVEFTLKQPAKKDQNEEDFPFNIS